MKMELRKFTMISLATLLLLGTITVFSQTAAANPAALLFVDPPEIVDPTLVPSVSNFDINVSVADIANMKICQFTLTYDNNVIGFIRIGFQSVNGQFPSPNLDINDAAGYVSVRLTYATAVTVAGATPLVTLTFHLRNRGSTPLDLTDTTITNPDGNALPHDVQDGFFAAIIRDVAVTNVVTSRAWAYQGWPVDVTVTVRNNGNVSETFDLHAYYDGNLIGTITVDDLVPGESRDELFAWDTTVVTPGTYTISAMADSVPFELNIVDNTFTDSTVLILGSSPGEIHDIAVYSVTLSNSWAYVGRNVTISVTALNTGAFSESFDMSTFYDDTVLIGTIHVDSLAPSDTFTAEFSLNTSTLLTCHTYTISGRTSEIPFEYSTINNVLVDGGLKIRLVGDITGDGKVDVRDVYAVSLAYGSIPGFPKWNPDADINGDLKVDIKDVYIVSRNFGQSCP